MASPRACVLIAASLVGYAAVLVAGPLPPSGGAALSYVVQTLTDVGACVAMGLRARRGGPGLRRARLLVMASMVAAALGGAVATLLVVRDGAAPTGLSPDDVLTVAFVPLAVAGLLSFPVIESEAGSGVRTLLDGLLAATALWFVVYAVVLQPAAVGAGLPSVDACVALAYPAADVLVLAMCASVLTRVAAEARR
ncbi:MAG: Diguanylate cyclase protein, partial [Frankiales bacterium]|nr:Diguanylate cyclase protein [Frankiales bacterium]